MAVRHRESLRHEIAPDVVVVGLVEQRAVEIEQHRVDRRPVGPRRFGCSGDMRGVSYGPRMDASRRTPRRFPHAQPFFRWRAGAGRAGRTRARPQRRHARAHRSRHHRRSRRSARRLRDAPASASCPVSSSRRSGAAKLFTSSGCRSTSRTPGFKRTSIAVLARRQARLREIGERLEKRARLPGRELAAHRRARPPHPRACTWRACWWNAATPATRRKPSIAG